MLPVGLQRHLSPNCCQDWVSQMAGFSGNLWWRINGFKKVSQKGVCGNFVLMEPFVFVLYYLQPKQYNTNTCLKRLHNKLFTQDFSCFSIFSLSFSPFYDTRGLYIAMQNKLTTYNIAWLKVCLHYLISIMRKMGVEKFMFLFLFSFFIFVFFHSPCFHNLSV